MKKKLSKLQKCVREVRVYGFKEVYYHVLHGITKQSEYHVKRMQQQDVAIRKMSEKKLVELMKTQFKAIHKKELNLENPRTFSEKCQWLKLYDATPIKTRLADKYLVRDWIEEKMGGDDMLIPLLGVYDSADEVDFDVLPNQFCIKTNHGCGMNYVVKDKSKLSAEDIENIRKKVNLWMATPFYIQNLELHYRDIPRKVLVEKYIEQMDGDLKDYKFYCFNGEPNYVVVIGDRDLANHRAKEVYCDMNWQRLTNLEKCGDFSIYDVLPPKPVCFDRMKEICRILSKDFSFVRVDLYEIDGKVKFGEMTFTPGAGFEKWQREDSNLAIGAMVQLPEQKYIFN